MKHVHLDSFKKIVLTVVVAILLPPQLVFSQGGALRVLSNVKGPAVTNPYGYSQLKSAYSNSTIYFSSLYSTEKKIIIHTHNTVTGKNGKLEIENLKKAKEMLSEKIESFAVNDKKIVFACSAHIFVFSFTSENTIKFEGKIDNKYTFIKCLPLGDKFLLYVQYNFHPRDADHKHVWATFDPVKMELTKVKLQPDENSKFASMVNSWIDTYNSQIVYADPLNYAITFYNEKFEPTDSIRLDELSANKNYIDSYKSENLHSKDAIMGLIATDDSLLTRIRKVYYLNDTTVLALVRLPQHFLRADYWQKVGGKWNRIHQDNSPEWFQDGEAYSKDNITYTDFFQNVYDFPYSGNYTFCLAYLPYIPIIETANFNRNTDYFKLQNDAIHNEFYFGIKQIQIALPVR